MRCVSICTCTMTMLSNFWMILSFASFFVNFLNKCNISLVLILFFLTSLFFLFENNYIFRVLFKRFTKRFSYFYHLLRNENFAYFLNNEIPKILILNIFQKYVSLFLLLKIFWITFTLIYFLN